MFLVVDLWIESMGSLVGICKSSGIVKESGKEEKA
jgi:hypothetical protein